MILTAYISVINASQFEFEFSVSVSKKIQLVSKQAVFFTSKNAARLPTSCVFKFRKNTAQTQTQTELLDMHLTL